MRIERVRLIFSGNFALDPESSSPRPVCKLLARILYTQARDARRHFLVIGWWFPVEFQHSFFVTPPFASSSEQIINLKSFLAYIIIEGTERND